MKTFGVDSPTPDNPASTSYPCHMMCRREHITHYENLAHLDQVVNTRFTFAGFPPQAPGRPRRPDSGAVALIGWVLGAVLIAEPRTAPRRRYPHQFWIEAAKIPAMSSSVTGRAHVASRRCCFIVPGTRSPMSASV